MVKKTKHPIAVIDTAVRYAIENSWELKLNKHGHAWGRLYCPGKKRGACIVSVWSSPRVPENHANQIIRRVKNCEHTL